MVDDARFERLLATVEHLSRSNQDLTKRVQQLEGERTMRLTERKYRALESDKEPPGAAFGVRSQDVGEEHKAIADAMLVPSR
ncbi:MAG: hypothetical protein U1E62_05330 [Alsobacter sp.]